jgi:hypothetical protein
MHLHFCGLSIRQKKKISETLHYVLHTMMQLPVTFLDGYFHTSTKNNNPKPIPLTSQLIFRQ